MKVRKTVLPFLYLKERSKVFLVFLLVNSIYFIIYLLSHVQGEALLYSLELSSTAFVMLVVIDYVHFKKKHITLKNMMNSIEINDIHAIVAEGILEQDYQELIECLKEKLMDTIQSMETENVNREDYLTMWTHQIKTPVAALRLVLSNMEPSKEKKQIEEELFQIEEYIHMVLLYLRMNSLKSDLLLKEYDLHSIAKQAVKKYSIIFINKHISLEFDEFHQKILTDEKWASFVVEQILSNALKYTQKGKIHIYVENEKTLVIEDTGIGIRSEDIKRVFEKGYTGYNGRRYKKSTGIGMYLCKSILDLLGHKIWIESEVSKGTKVKIDFSHDQIDVRD